MDNTVNNSGSVAVQPRQAKTTSNAAPADTAAAAPEKVETSQAVPATERAQKPALQQSAPNSALTTYKDQDSGRLIVRVYDRENGDILVEFPPERAFRSVEEVLVSAGMTPKKSFSI
jgi:uncharacterized FlaG/YvyC family protein